MGSVKAMVRAGGVLVVSGTMLGGCSTDPNQWFRAATDPFQTLADLMDCQRFRLSAETPRYTLASDQPAFVYQERAPSTCGRSRNGVCGDQLGRLRAIRNFEEGQRLEACMAALGYARVRRVDL